jgi:excisionase family DNA binding protein
MDESGRSVELVVPQQLIDAIAERVADLVLERLDEVPRGAIAGRWMRSGEAAEYLGWNRSALYKRISRHAMPHYKVDGILLFKSEELDAWLEQYREEPQERHGVPSSPPVPRRSRPRRRELASIPTPSEPNRKKAAKQTSGKRSRPLPPPISGSEEHKNHWARELEITQAELDEMSPTDFRKAWEARNKRLEDGGVFEHIDELTDAYGWGVIDKMTAGELITAVATLGLAPSTSHSASEQRSFGDGSA